MFVNILGIIDTSLLIDSLSCCLVVLLTRCLVD